MLDVYLTRRALRDFHALKLSLAAKSAETAVECLEMLDAALVRLGAKPKLLEKLPDFPLGLDFYRVHGYWLVCAKFDKMIYVLTVQKVENLERLQVLEPMLGEDAELYYRMIQLQQLD